jgi:prepilin-type N-terminal cleavage/methylation domain-containing protein
MLMSTKLSNNRGFTLIETLVAILIFASSIVALLTATSSGLSEVTLLRNKLTANYLAQQGIEITRNIRDRNVTVSGATGWTGFLGETANCQNTNGCTFSPFPPDAPMALTCIPGVSDPCDLNYSSTAGVYVPSGIPLGDVASNFHQSIVVTPTANPEEVKVTSTVTWHQGVGIQQVVLEEYIYNW